MGTLKICHDKKVPPHHLLKRMFHSENFLEIVYLSFIKSYMTQLYAVVMTWNTNNKNTANNKNTTVFESMTKNIRIISNMRIQTFLTLFL